MGFDTGQSMKIGICGTINFDSLARELDLAVPGNDIIVGQTGLFQAELNEPIGEFRTLDLCIIALDWRDIVPGLYARAYGDDPQMIMVEFQDACNCIAAAIGSFRKVSPARTLIFTPITDGHSPAGFIDRLLQPSTGELFAECQQRFNALCRSFTDLFAVDTDAICRSIGADNAFDPSTRFSAHQPFSPVMTIAVARHIGRMVEQCIKGPIKCLVLDLDNTLWGGIVGEDGLQRLVLGDTGPGRAYRDFQLEIVRLHRQGVILAICSKNTTCEAMEVMERHPDMLIRPAMISSFRINWEDKPRGILGIAAELNIGLEAIMFVDDNPMEREMVHSTLPQVEILDLPSDPAYYATVLRGSSRLWPVQVTAEDRRKGTFFSQDKLRRQQAELAVSMESYLMGARICATVVRADNRILPRATQLFNKTNQFTMTTIRYSQAELEQLTRNPANRLFCLNLTDRYGEYGIVAAALITSNTIDSLLLSCRAFGKQVETAFLIHVLRWMKDQGYTHTLGRFIPSGKNAMAKDFYKRMGFSLSHEADGLTDWVFDLSQEIPVPPAWIAISSGA
jgi:FkbH-like protein